MTVAQGLPLVDGKWRTLKIKDWPLIHQAAWQSAIRRDSPLRRGGRAASLSPETRDMMCEVYGQYLWWCGTSGELNPQAEPAVQMAPDLVTAFIIERRKTVSDNTTYNNLRMLTMMMKCLAPDHDWKWIWRHSVAPRRWEAKAARRPRCQFPAGLLLHRLVTAMQYAVEQPLERLPPERLRDCLLVAIAINSGLRLRNHAAMRLEHNLIRRKEGWEVMFDPSEVKNSEPILFQVPSILNAFIERYLNIDRPRLAGRCKSETDAVWLSLKGGPLSKPGIALVFNRIGREMLGYSINPHSVRHVQATRILDNDPRDLNVASFALAHGDIGTVSQFYDQSGSRAAQEVWRQMLADLTPADRTSPPQRRKRR